MGKIMDIRISDNQKEGYQKIRLSKKCLSLISWCPDIHYLIIWYPDTLKYV